MGSDGQHTIGSGFIESFDSRYPLRILEILLQDRTAGRNIIWADNEYEALGEGYMGDDEITVEKITGPSSGVIKPRIAKEQEHQSKRTKSRAEVFTPSWLCNQMNNDIDAVWFSRRNVFNREDNQAWHITQEPIVFPKKRGYGWRAYVESPRLEITCGEAPFVCSRYDSVTGDVLPVDERIGFLDRKLRVVSKKTKSRREWVKWAICALKASYGFEYQGDNLLLARINVFETFCEHLHERWGMGITDDELDQVAWIVSWNFWQMNGFTYAVPTNKMDAVVQSALFGYEEPVPEPLQPTLFDLLDDPISAEKVEKGKDEEPGETVPLCVIYDWQENEPVEFQAMKGKERSMDKKFYAVIGNPPYQEQTDGTSDKPIYNYFMDEACKISNKVELVTPARFLFNAGKTPKEWNRKMLADPHLKVMEYYQKSSVVFPNTDIKGGVAITYHDSTSNFGPIEVFIHFKELQSIKNKVISFHEKSLSDYVYAPESYRFTDELHIEHPEIKYIDNRHGILSKGHDYDLTTNIFDKLNKIVFFKSVPDTDNEYIRILGRKNNERTYMYIKRSYIINHPNLEKWKVILPKSNGSGALGEVLSTPLIGEPLIGHTQSFISIGCFNSKDESESLLKYIKTKFARTMLGILKITQHNPQRVWAYVPLQDFTSSSNIVWSKSISDIDQQLYKKYGLTNEEIDFIESHVKEMN